MRGKLRLAASRLWSVAQPLRSQEQTLPSTQEDYRTGFYNMYRREAEEYDREFIKKHDEDLSTTLIFVSIFTFLRRVCVLTPRTGWSVLRRYFRIHHPGSTQASAGPER